MSLPELPDPFALSVSVHEGDTPSKTYAECMLYQAHPNEKQRLYTADQMRAYALQAVEALRREPMTDEFINLLAYKSGFQPVMIELSGTQLRRFARNIGAHYSITQKEQG